MAALVCIGAVPVSAQTTSAWLPLDHWAARAALRLHALGLAPRGFDAAAREHTSVEIGTALRHAWLLAAARALPRAVAVDALRGAYDEDALRLADMYVRRYADERPAAFARAFALPRDDWQVHAEAAAGFLHRADALLAGGFTLDREPVPPRPVPDYSTIGGTIDVATAWRDRVALSLFAAVEGSAARIERATLDARIAQHVALWAGRRAAAYAPLRSGGLVQHGAVAFEGGGVRTESPVRVPRIGYVSAEMFVGTLDRNGHVARPWLWTTRLHVQPHARFDIGGTRAAVFGALGAATVGPRQVAEVIVGANLSGDYADDQVASLDARWRPPLGGRVPLELYGEWGIHDVDIGVFLDVPAFGIGARVPMLPYAPQLSLAVEHVRIGRSNGENPPWYQHFELADGWTEDGVLMGHPLGGHGREWRAILAGDLSRAAVQFEVQAFRRARGDENLFAPVRAGRSNGIGLRADIELVRRVSVRVGGSVESASAWTEQSLSVLAVLRL